MFAAPISASNPHAALHFVKNQEEIVFIANTAQAAQEFAAEMIVAPLSLNGFDDDSGDIRRFPGQDLADFFFRAPLLLNDILNAAVSGQREIQDGSADSGPGKFRKIIRL